MRDRRCRILLVSLILLIAVLASASAAGVTDKPVAPPRPDRYGDPVPPGAPPPATSRHGTDGRIDERVTVELVFRRDKPEKILEERVNSHVAELVQRR